MSNVQQSQSLIVVMVGIPACGKSTLAKKLASMAWGQVGCPSTWVIELDAVNASFQNPKITKDASFDIQAWKASRSAVAEAVGLILEGNHVCRYRIENYDVYTVYRES